MSSPVLIAASSKELFIGGRHPNELDLRRIARMLGKRTRYRYVAASVVPAVCGYRIISPCCSRSISSDGSTIDIALIQFDEASMDWMLFSKDHGLNQWKLRFTAPKIDAVMSCLIDDRERQFWQ